MNPHHQRRFADPPEPGWRRRLWQAERVWQDAVPLLAVLVAGYAVLGLEDKVDKVDALQAQQIEGRRIAIDVLCGGVAGVQAGGRAVIQQELPGIPAPPSTPEQRTYRKKAANAYNRIISQTLISQVGENGEEWSAEDLLNGDGTINCERVKRISRAVPGQEP